MITGAPVSPRDERRRRERLYIVLMVVHIVGLAAGGLLYERAFWLGLVILILTGPLPWVAVVLANDGPPRRRTGTGPASTAPGLPPPPLDDGNHPGGR